MRKHEGVRTAKPVMWYQDYTFMINDDLTRRLTDDELLADWRKEFPEAEGKVFTSSFSEGLAILRGVRAHYNIGRQGHGHRSLSGELMGGAERLSLPYDSSRSPYWYSERWRDAILEAKPDFRRNPAPIRVLGR